MSARRSLENNADRAKAAAAAIAVNLVLALALITGLALHIERRREEILETFDVAIPPPPSPPAIRKRQATEAKNQSEGAPGKKSQQSPVVARPSPIPRTSPVVAAPTPGTGSETLAGNANRGVGPGAGGSGSGSGGGGAGAGGISTEARLLGGNRSRLPSRMLRDIPQPGGFAHLLLSVGTSGTVTNCDVLTSSGFPAIDEALCSVMRRGSRWQPARDRAGQPIPVKVRYTATWSKD